MTETAPQADHDDDDYEDTPDLDLGTCPYYAHYRGGPFGTCTFGCREEPECVTCEPEEGWPGYPRDPVTGFPVAAPEAPASPCPVEAVFGPDDRVPCLLDRHGPEVPHKYTPDPCGQCDCLPDDPRCGGCTDPGCPCAAPETPEETTP